MATIHVPAEKDDVSYSHTLKKLFRVNVDKGPEPARNVTRNFGQTGISRSSVPSRCDQTVQPDSPVNQQTRSPNGSPGRSPGTTGLNHNKLGLQKASGVPGVTSGSNGKASRRTTYPQPEPPASFMRSPYSSPAPRRRQRRSTSGSTGSNGNGSGHVNGHTGINGKSNGHVHGHSHGHGHSHSHHTHGPVQGNSNSGHIHSSGAGSGAGWKEKSGSSNTAMRSVAEAVGTGSHGATSPLRRVASLTGGMLAAALSADNAAAHGSHGSSVVSVSWSPHVLSPRLRGHSSGISNLSYKPPSNVTAEPAAAVLQRRRAAFAASRGGIGSPVSGAGGGGGGSCLGPSLFGGGNAAAGSGAVAGDVVRASWSVPNGQTSSGPLSLQLLSIGLGSSLDMDSGGKAADGGDGGGNGGGAAGFGSFGEDGVNGGGGDSYDNIWPVSGWRALAASGDGDAEAARTAADGLTAEPGAGLAYYTLPTATGPLLGPLLRRNAMANAAGGAADGGCAAGTPKPSIFAPPQQLYMKASDDLDDGPGGPIATVATAAAKAGRTPPPLSPSPTHSSMMTDRPSLRIPSLDLGLLRPSMGALMAAGIAAAGGGTGAGDGASPDGSGGAVSPIFGALRSATLNRWDSDLGQNCNGDADGDDGDDDGTAAATAATPVAPPPIATRTAGELLKLASRPMILQSQSGTPSGAGASSLLKPAQAVTASPRAAAASGDMGGGSGGDSGAGGLTEAQLRAKRRSSARGALLSLDGEPSGGGTSGPYAMGDTTKMLQVGISVAALIEVVKVLGPSQRFATTAEVYEHWLMPATRNSQCRFLDLVMARVKIVLGDSLETFHVPTTPGARGSFNGMPVLHPDRTWFGPPDHYVIHAWSGHFLTLVSALREYCAVINKTPSSTYVWLDLVAANHHPGRRDKKELPHCKQIMSTARKALLVLDPMANSLTRLWCLYEIWVAACAAPGASPAKLTLLNAGADWDAFADSFFRIDLSRCMTSNPDDRAKLLEDMIRTSHDAGSYGSSSQHASGTTISPYGVVAALPQLSATVRGAIFDAAAGDVVEARRGARGGGGGIVPLLEAVERYAMIRRLAGGHVEAEEQLEAAVAVAMGVSGARNLTSARPSSPLTKSTATNTGGGGGGGGGGGSSSVVATASGDGSAPSGGNGGGTGGSVVAKTDPAATPDQARTESGGGEASGSGGGGGGSTPIVTLPPIFPSLHTSSTITPSTGGSANGGGGGGVAATSILTGMSTGPVNTSSTQNSVRHFHSASAHDDDGLMAAAAAAAAATAAAAANGSGLSSAAWRKKPATLAALAVLQAEHGRLIQASTHAAMALSCVPGLTLIRPVNSIDGDSDDAHEHGDDRGGSRLGYHQKNHSGGAAGGGGSGGGGNRQRSLSPPTLHTLPSSRSRSVVLDNAGGSGGGGGGEHERKSYGGQRRSGGGAGGGGGGGGGALSGPPPAPGEVAWKGSYWELTSPQDLPADAMRAIFMASIVEAACGRHEAAAQLALQAGLARSAVLGPAHPATIATKRAAVPHLIHLGRLPEAQLLAKSLLKEAVAEHGEMHPSVAICHGAVALVLAAQDKAELAYSSAQRGAEILASCLGKGHPATLDALQLCADMLESAREYGKAVALMRMVVKGRSAPGAIRASPASSAFLAPNNRLLHLRTIAALEEKAMSEEQSSVTWSWC